MRKVIYLVIIIAGLIGLLYYYFPEIKRVLLEKKTQEIVSDSSSKNNGEVIADFQNELKKDKQQQESLKQEGKIFQEVTLEDCKTECQGFSGEILEYCQEVCGLIPLQENLDNCEDISGIKKDYCLKNLAIERKDFETCEKISDENIKKTCQNRITEEIFDSNWNQEALEQ